MFILKKKFRFEAAHQLPHHDGKCARLHGHSWLLTIAVGGWLVKQGPKQGMVIDYGDLSAFVKPYIEHYLDHWYLNETLKVFGIDNPTSENIAQWLFNELRAPITMAGARLLYVKIEETCTASCKYTGSAD